MGVAESIIDDTCLVFFYGECMVSWSHMLIFDNKSLGVTMLLFSVELRKGKEILIHSGL